MSRVRLMLAAVLLTASMVGIGWGIGRWRKAASTDSLPPNGGNRGALLFQVHCAACHGSEGRGDGSSVADSQMRRAISRFVPGDLHPLQSRSNA